MTDYVFTRDVAFGELSPATVGDDETDASDSSDSWGFDTDEATVVHIENPPWTEAFATDTFLKFDATVARPIEQTYIRDGEHYTFKKPQDELKATAWSVDNSPYPLGHPESGPVKEVDDIHGFVRRPDYDEDADELNASVYIPTNDEKAHEFIEDNKAVSLGFWNTLDWDTDEDGIDAYQRNIRVDHVAGVRKGRCSVEDGCGLHAEQAHKSADSAEGRNRKGCGLHADSSDVHGHVIETNEMLTSDAPDGIYTTDGRWFAVGPDEHTKESTSHPDDAMYPVGSCSSVEDAWRLRNHAEDLKIDRSTLADRIQRAGEAQDCSGMPWTSDEELSADEIEGAKERYTIATDDEIYDSMSDEKNCGCHDDNPEMDFDEFVSGLSIDALAKRNDAVAELQSDVDELRNEKQTLEDDKEALESTVEDLKADLAEFERDEVASLVDEITSLTDAFGDEEELMEAFDEGEKTKDDIESHLETAKKLAEDFGVEVDDSPVSGDAAVGGDDSPSDQKYEAGQSYSLPAQ